MVDRGVNHFIDGVQQAGDVLCGEGGSHIRVCTTVGRAGWKTNPEPLWCGRSLAIRDGGKARRAMKKNSKENRK